MNIHKSVQQLAVLLAASFATGAGADYVGTLKLPGTPSSSSGFYAFSASAPSSVSPSFVSDSGPRLKLGYKYSRYLSVESEYFDFGANGNSVFTSPSNLSSAFRSTGFGVDTIATLPLWRQFSFYGRFGAYNGSRNVFLSNPITLLGDNSRTRVRYGLGVRYDFTNSFGIRAEMERYTPAGSLLTGESEADLFSVGLSWRF